MREAVCTRRAPATHKVQSNRPCTPHPSNPAQYAEAMAFKVYLEERRLIMRAEMPLVELEEC